MAKVINISVHGLTPCPHCQRHLRVAADWRESVCPFCEKTLLEPNTPAHGPVRRRRASLLAAGLVSAVLVGTGCPADVYGAPPAPPDMAPGIEVADTGPSDAGAGDGDAPAAEAGAADATDDP